MLRASLALLVIALAALAFGATAAAGGGCRVQDTTVTEAKGTAIDISNCKFGPVVLFAPVGATVRWAQNDPVPHNVVGIGWGSASYVASGGKIEYTFDKPGIYPYHCSLHPDMNGIVVVGDTPLAGAAAPALQAQPEPSALVAGLSSERAPDGGLALLAAAIAASCGLGFVLGRRWSA